MIKRPVTVEDDYRMMRIPTPTLLLVIPGGVALSDSEKADALADSLEVNFRR